MRANGTDLSTHPAPSVNGTERLMQMAGADLLALAPSWLTLCKTGQLGITLLSSRISLRIHLHLELHLDRSAPYSLTQLVSQAVTLGFSHWVSGLSGPLMQFQIKTISARAGMSKLTQDYATSRPILYRSFAISATTDEMGTANPG